jgi:predicted secreted acid phosphatase
MPKLGIVLFAGLVCIGGLEAEPSLNLSEAKERVREYHDSGAYHDDVEQVAAWAIAWIEARADRRTADERLVVVMDVDETVLSNYPNMDEQDFGYVPAEWVKWVERSAAPAIEPMKRVFETARQHDIAVIFLTGRTEPEEAEGTIKNLRQVGLGDYERIIFKGPTDTAPTAAERKRLRRRQLEEEGWTIIASLGDQGSDLAGGHAERIFKLPNPFYKVP